MKDLHVVCKSFPKGTKFENVDFLGTLSFNVREIFQKETGGCNAFIEVVLNKFRFSLCYENYHSACQKTETAKTWGQPFVQFLKSEKGSKLRKAILIWNGGNIVDCYKSLSDPNHPNNITKLLKLSEAQAKATHTFIRNPF